MLTGSNFNFDFLVLKVTTSRSYSIVGICPRSNTVSPSIGSLRTALTLTLESKDSLRRVPEDSRKEVLASGLESPNQASPKRKRQLQKTCPVLDEVHAGSLQQLHENACKEHIDMSAAENDVVQVEGDRPEAKKKKRGACKKTPLDAAEEDGWVCKSVDELAQESEDDVISNSEGADDDSGR